MKRVGCKRHFASQRGMDCIFCKNNSSGSVSVEHIIPESLGNSKHVLPQGIVCDKCNNYFARKIEKPILDSEYFTHSRFINYLPNKRGRVPPIENQVRITKSYMSSTLSTQGIKSCMLWLLYWASNTPSILVVRKLKVT